jgi:hypothetical protein
MLIHNPGGQLYLALATPFNAFAPCTARLNHSDGLIRYQGGTTSESGQMVQNKLAVKLAGLLMPLAASTRFVPHPPE